MKKIFLIGFCLFSIFLAQNILAQTTAIDSMIRLLKGNLQDTQRVNLLVKIAKNLDDISDTANLSYANKALALAQQIEYDHGIAAAYAVKGLSEGTRGNFSNSINAHQKALKFFTELNDSLGQAKALGNIGLIEYSMGDYTSAVEHSFQAIRLYEPLHNYRGLFSCHLTIGNVMNAQKDYTGALKQFKELLAICEVHFSNQPNFKAIALTSLGNIYNLKANYDSAGYYYEQGYAVFEKVGSPYEKSVCLNNLGTIRQNQKKFGEAEELFRRSLQLRRMNGDSDGVCSTIQNLASLSNELKRFDSAHYYYDYALYLARLSESKSQQLEIFHGLAQTFANLKRFDSAYYYSNQFIDLNDSLTGEESVNTVNQLRSRYDSEKQQHQLDLIDSERKAEKANTDRNMLLLLVGILVLLFIIAFIYHRYRVKQKLNITLEQNNIEITMQKKSITDSINYAKKIQDSILPPESQIKSVLPNSFILYEPKDVVSGDFYWLDKRDKFSIFAAVDCTGHGVPGALMSVIGFNLLNQAVNEMGLTKPSDILHHLDFGVNKLLRQSDGGNTVKDGMDIALCAYDSTTRKLQYAGVFNPAYVFNKGELIQIKPDKFPIGINADGITDNYTNNELQLFKGDMIYLFSDGYCDQFGGPMGKKFKFTRFRELLQKIHSLDCDEQKHLLRKEYLDWKGEMEQVDDILVIGLRVD